MSPAVAEMDFTLDTMGFERMGVLEVKIQIAAQPGYEWVYHSEDGAIYAEMVQLDASQPVMVQFATCFPDNAMIITRFPMGERIMTPNYHSRFAAGSVEAALEYHQRQLEEWRLIHGTPLITRTIEDTDRYDDLWRIHHRRRDYRRIIVTHFGVGMVWLLTGLMIGYDVLSVHLKGSYLPFTGLLLPVMLGINAYIMHRAEKANSRPDLAVDSPQLKKKKNFAWIRSS
jgi:hypothetical protein